MKIFRSRYSLLLSFICLFIILSFAIRTGLIILSWNKSGILLTNLPMVYARGLIYDISVACYFCIGYAVYLLMLPEKLNRSLGNRIITYILFFIIILIIMFS